MVVFHQLCRIAWFSRAPKSQGRAAPQGRVYMGQWRHGPNRRLSGFVLTYDLLTKVTQFSLPEVFCGPSNMPF